MQHAILAKLRKELSSPIEQESQVVYILVEIRKYLEHVDPESRQFRVLRVYLDWTVHVRLAGTRARELLLRLDEALAKVTSKEHQDEELKEVHDFFSLGRFQDELRNFLQVNGLPADLIQEPARWGKFLDLYANVVSDCPFDFAEQSNSFKAISKATLEIRKVPDEANGGSRVVAWAWKLELLDGASREFTCTHGYSV